jgi:GT2 family glycosyltransferase
MSHKSIDKVAVIIPNLNGADYLSEAIDSLLNQSFSHSIIVVENASTDNSMEILASYGDRIVVLRNERNLGFAGGVNTGIRYALDHNYGAIALFNNDAVADREWLHELVSALNTYEDTGIATCRLQLSDGTSLDSTGEFYTTWGLPYPRGRGEPIDTYPKGQYIFGASGGASIYRSTVFETVGMFDDTFFAYYEDTDISFRAQLAGIKIRYVPSAIAFHRQGETSKRMPGDFAVYQTFKNLPLLFLKNVPRELLFTVGVRFYPAYVLIAAKAIINGKFIATIKGIAASIKHTPKAVTSRQSIQKHKTVNSDYISSIIIHDLPPDQTGLRKLRALFFRK